MTEQPKQNWLKKHKEAIIAILIVWIFIVIASYGSSHPTKQAPVIKTAPPTTTETTRASPPPVPTQQVLLDLSGSGSQQTASFTVGSKWNVTYTFDCSAFGGSGNFQFDVDNTDGSDTYDTGANDLAASGGTTDYYYDSGEHYLSINSECAWHLTVKG